MAVCSNHHIIDTLGVGLHKQQTQQHHFFRFRPNAANLQDAKPPAAWWAYEHCHVIRQSDKSRPRHQEHTLLTASMCHPLPNQITLPHTESPCLIPPP